MKGLTCLQLRHAFPRCRELDDETDCASGLFERSDCIIKIGKEYRAEHLKYIPNRLTRHVELLRLYTHQRAWYGQSHAVQSQQRVHILSLRLSVEVLLTVEQSWSGRMRP